MSGPMANLNPITGCSGTKATGTALGTARFLSSRNSLSRRPRIPLDIPPPFPVTKKCPDPRCSCPPTPDMPERLPLDYDQPLNGTMAAYAQQVVICTGKRDWTSRIEDDGENQGWGELVRGLKSLLGRRGRFADPFNNVMISNSSLPLSPIPSSSTTTTTATTTTTTTTNTASALLFPTFKYFPSIPVHPSQPSNTTPTLATFVQAFLLPTKLSAMAESLPEDRRNDLTRKPDLQSHFPDAVDIQHSPIILICGHGGRDMRCGIMAPVLEKQFQTVLQSKGLSTTTTDSSNSGLVDSPTRAHIGLISHIGGHKYAGNVIVYIPRKMKYYGYPSSNSPHPLAGKGIWYGRVEPKHVEGIVEETIMGGRVVADHFRGGIDAEDGVLRL